MRRYARAAAVVLLVVAAAVALAARLTDRLTTRSPLVWSDEFNGARMSPPNPRIWQHATGGGGWGNGELECYTSSVANSALDGHGHLVITARHDPGHRCTGGTVNDYTSARLITDRLRHVRYGSIRVRAKLPTASGTWPAIWALGDDQRSVGWPRCGEIDVSEVIGSQPGVVHGSLHGPERSAPTQAYSVTSTYTSATALSDGFHVYGVDWRPRYIRFSIDGHAYFTATKAAVLAQGAWVFDQPFFLLLNLAVGGTWPGAPSDPAAYPQRLIVDYVRVYRDVTRLR